MRKTAIPLAATFAAALTTSLCPTARAQNRADQRADLGAEETRLLQLVNAYRAQHGAPPLVDIPLLNTVAYDHSLDMARRRFFAHENPDGLSPFDRMEHAGYEALAMGENLAAGFDDAEHTFEQWRTSPSHNAAMLDAEYRGVGIGRVYAPGTASVVYWTMDLGDLADGERWSVPTSATSAYGPSPHRVTQPWTGGPRAQYPRTERRRAARAGRSTRRAPVLTVDCPGADRP